jgi:type IV secretory pathway VirB4 component
LFSASNEFIGVSDIIHWDSMLEPDVVFTRTGAMMSVLRYLPHDLASASFEMIEAAAQALNSAVQRFGTGWALWFECQRNETDALMSVFKGRRYDALFPRHRRRSRAARRPCRAGGGAVGRRLIKL